MGVAGMRHAFRLHDVLEVTAAAALLPASATGALLIGYLDLRGELLPVLGAREFLAVGTRPLSAADRFVVVDAPFGRAAIVVDSIEGVEDVVLILDAGRTVHDSSTFARRMHDHATATPVAFIDLERLLTGSTLAGDLDGGLRP
ncbi:MAG TPA: chemotaxis protein CheW [Patescibacteria group bacterium]|nr:chemotaxis protein CheW [Patescibacteria group bacterium]